MQIGTLHFQSFSPSSFKEVDIKDGRAGIEYYHPNHSTLQLQRQGQEVL
jgi:hypothetical protein